MLQTTGLRLGKRELEILNIVWELSEATVQDVVDRLERPAKYSTVLTMMRTLESKGVLEHRVFGRTFVYRASVPRQEVQTSALSELRRLLFGGSAVSLMNTMLTQSPMSAAELADLRRVLDEAAKGVRNA
jgi:BlaI family penicillinase repressor